MTPYSHFHSKIPPENFGCNWTSIRRPVVSTGVNTARLYLSNSVPKAAAPATGCHWSPVL